MEESKKFHINVNAILILAFDFSIDLRVELFHTYGKEILKPVFIFHNCV